MKGSPIGPKHQDNSLDGCEEKSFPQGAENYQENSPVSRTNTNSLISHKREEKFSLVGLTLSRYFLVGKKSPKSLPCESPTHTPQRVIFLNGSYITKDFLISQNYQDCYHTCAHIPHELNMQAQTLNKSRKEEYRT